MTFPQVTTYRANDGSFHESRENAARHEVKLAIIEHGAPMIDGAFSDSGSDTVAIAIQTLAAQVAISPAVTKAFARVIEAHELDSNSATHEAAGIVASAKAEPDDPRKAASKGCPSTGDGCEWADYCLAHDFCHIKREQQKAIAEGANGKNTTQ